MNNKVKSLLYLSCFVLSAVIYQVTGGGEPKSEKMQLGSELKSEKTLKSVSEDTNQITELEYDPMVP